MTIHRGADGFSKGGAESKEAEAFIAKHRVPTVGARRKLPFSQEEANGAAQVDAQLAKRGKEQVYYC